MPVARLKTSSGWVDIAQQSQPALPAGCRVYVSPDVTVPNPSGNISWNAEEYDTDAFHDLVTNNDRVTIPPGKAGYYLLTASASVAGTGGTCNLSLSKNAVNLRANGAVLPNTADATRLTVTTVAYLVPGDYIQVNLYHASGVTRTIQGSYTSFAVHLLGAAVSAPPIPLVAALPSSPYDGQECYFQDATMAAAGVVWHLRYRAAAAGSYKWEYIGGPGIELRDDTDRAYTSTGAWTGSPAGNILQITTPLAGDWDLQFDAHIYTLNAPVAGQVGTGVGLGAATPPTFSTSAYAYTPGNQTVSCRGFGRWGSLPAGSLLRNYVIGPSTTDVHPRGRYLKITPVRVG